MAYHYLDGLLEALGVTADVTLVIHDWGSALGFHWAKNHPDAVKGIAYMEGIVMPVEWEDWPEAARGIFQGFRSAKGEDMVLQRNLFINADPGSILVGRQREYCRSWPNQTEVTVRGNHFLQEDSPVEIGRAVAGWLAGL